MKNLLYGILMLLIPVTGMAQNTGNEQMRVRDDLLRKSKSQKTAAITLLAVGAVAAVGGALMFDQNFDIMSEGDDGMATVGAVLAVTGGLAMLGSIPLFIASSNNKKKAMTMDVGVRMGRTPLGMMAGRSGTMYPELALRVQLR